MSCRTSLRSRRGRRFSSETSHYPGPRFDAKSNKFAVVAPSVIVIVPLVGYSLLGDDRRRLYGAANDVGDNLFRAIRHSYRTVGAFLDRGSFRPIGRAVENIERSVVFDAAEATGLAPHAVNGVLRLVLIAMLAVGSLGLVSAVLRSAGIGLSGRHPAVVLYPMVLAATLVAGGHDSPITSYSLILIGSVILMLAAALWVARDEDMVQRRLAWHEPVAMLGLGAVLAATYDLTYVAPPFVAAFVVARAAAGSSARQLLRMASVRRWTYLTAGFLAVFIPARIEIAKRCSVSPCYSASDVDLTAAVFGRTADRWLTGAPPAGWRYTAGVADEAGVRFGLADFLRNVLLIVLLALVAYITVTATRNIRRAAPVASANSVGWRRPAASLGALGAATALLPALLVSLSWRTQRLRPQIGEGWRETIMVQVGWSLMAAAVLVCLFGIARGPGSARIATVVVTAILGGTMTLTLLANARLMQVDGVTPLHAITSEMATAAIHFDPTAAGNARRCLLIDHFTAILPDPQKWVSGPNVWAELDELMLGVQGMPYCDPALNGGKKPADP